MDGSALKIFRTVAKRYDVTLEEALSMASKKHEDYRDQYPLAMLFEGEYLGVTMNHTPPHGAEKMREYSQAVMLHDMSLKKKPDGSVAPAAIFCDGTREHVFLKAKGALYLDEIRKKRWDRFFSFLVGVLVGLSTLTFKSWIDKQPNKAPTPTSVTSPAAQEPRQP